MREFRGWGPERADCSDLPEVDTITFHDLSGHDIKTENGRYYIYCDDARAAQYVADVMRLTDVEEF